MARLRLEDMSLDEKLDAMESLWDDLCGNPDRVPSPAWHGEELRDRKAALERGEDSLEDWDSAKARIRRETR